MSLSVPPAPSSPIAAWRWGVVWLLFLATMLAYTDRLALNNTQRYLLAEFEPDPDKQNAVYADIQFAFGLSFALFQVVAGFLIDRFSLRWLYLGAITVWSAAGVLTGFVPAGAVGGLIACRVALGIGEAFNWPCAVACVRRVIPRESRGLANGIFHSGASIGAVATPFLVLLFVNTETGYGWRALFVVVGAVGAAWVVLWALCTGGDRGREIDALPTVDADEWDSPSPDEVDSREELPRTPFLSVFGRPLFWICLATGVCVNLCWHFYNQWFPRYLTEDLRVSARDEQLVLAGFFIAADLGSMVSGWTTRALARSGFSVERSRQLVMTGVAGVVCLATVPAAYWPVESLWTKFALFFVVASASMGGFAIFFSLAQDIVPHHTAKILGVCGCVSWLVISGVTKLAGSLAGPGKYAELFVAVGCVPLVAAAAGWFWPRPAGQGNSSSPVT
ncbi:MAG: D-galactonate transporter [Gemmataceae bacterium]|nr:D-galactonate transporter [Gemmataceae bacterium]